MSCDAPIVIALGGNAIARAGDDGTVAAQYVRAREALGPVADLVCAGARVVLTHGNGPVVGNIVLRGEMASEQVPPTPLFIAGADSEGGIGLMLQQVLGNRLRELGCERRVVSVVTQVVVDLADPAFRLPTKPIGPYFGREQAVKLASERGWDIAEEPGRGWRRVVPSPRPLEVVEADAVAALAEAGMIAIAAGGGGVPVSRAPSGQLAGVDAVVDKDWASAVLGVALGARALVLAMEADAVYEAFGTPKAHRIARLTADEVEALVRSGVLPTGTIEPKVSAAAWFVRATGAEATICATSDLADALAGCAGTRITS